MASQSQITANTLNAQLSTGPQTESGKLRSSQNSFKHGLTAATLILPEDEMEVYRQFSAGIKSSLAPVGILEEQLAQIIADTHWRVSRVPALEANLFALAQFEPLPEHLATLEDSPVKTALVEANALLKHERQLRNLHLQERRLHRMLQDTMSQLTALQGSRAVEEQPEPDSPSPSIGFDFTERQNAYKSPAVPKLQFVKPLKKSAGEPVL